MKHIHSFFTGLLLALTVLPAFAESVVTRIGSPVKDINSIKVGDRVLLFCNGPVNPNDPDYGTRNAFLIEEDGYDVNLSRGLRENDFSSADYLWEVISCQKKGNDLKISFKSPKGNYLPTFIDDIDTYGKWARWMGRTVASKDSVGVYTMTATEVPGADSLFYFIDKNGVYFNGQNFEGNATTANFVGWNGAGGNSIYMMYKPEIRDEQSYKFTFYLQDEYENMKPENGEYLVEAKDGETLNVPEWAEHHFVNAINADNGDEIAFPYVVDADKLSPDSVPFIIFTYKSNPYYMLHCLDRSTRTSIYEAEGYFVAGQKLAMPETAQLGMGYELVGPDEMMNLDSIDLGDEDIDIVLEYEYGNQGIPFATTHVTDGQFAENTPWYLMTIRDNKVLAFRPGNGGVNCRKTSTYDDSNLWAFEGDLTHGFVIYNKKAGARQILWAKNGNDGTRLELADRTKAEGSAHTFDLGINGNGFYWKLHGTANAYANDYAANGELKFWASDKSKTDAGSKFVFTLHSDEIEKATRLAEFIAYANTENCVGGWTTAQLTDLKKAIEDDNTDACRQALQVLKTLKTIEFDARKAYTLVSAYNGYITHQPGATYAVALNANTHAVEWKALNEHDSAFRFGFHPQPDSLYNLIAIDTTEPVTSFRTGGRATCAVWRSDNGTGHFTEGITAAKFRIVPSPHAPAAYYLIHDYDNGNSVALAGLSAIKGTPRVKASDAMGTEGYLSGYNNNAADYNNYWRLKVVGDWDGIATGIEEAVEPSDTDAAPTIYDLSGRQVKRTGNGVYIVNGKKVM